MLRRLTPDRAYTIRYEYHKYDNAQYAIYNYDGDFANIRNEYDGRDFVCRTFNNICDPCCGYGIIAEPILTHGKRGVLSDINADCIHYVKDTFLGGS